jgi:hypothetical protein
MQRASAPTGLRPPAQGCRVSRLQSIGCYLSEEYRIAIGRSRIYARTLSSQIDNRLSSSSRFHQHVTNNRDHYYSASN